jgi:hypothetical protein
MLGTGAEKSSRRVMTLDTGWRRLARIVARVAGRLDRRSVAHHHGDPFALHNAAARGRLVTTAGPWAVVAIEGDDPRFLPAPGSTRSTGAKRVEVASLPFRGGTAC